MKITKTLFLIVTLLSVCVPSTGDDTVPIFDDVVFETMSPDNESTIRKVLTSEQFYLPWAYLAHDLGYGWVGGNTNGNNAVGKEFDYRRVQTRLDDPKVPDNKYRYVFSGRYDPKGPGGYWADKRFRMAFSNIQWLMEPGSLELDDPQLYDKKPIKEVTVLLENYSDQTDTGIATLSYNSTVAWSKVDTLFVSSGIVMTNSLKVGLPLVAEAETSVSVDIGAGESWSEMNSNSTTTGQSATYNATLPAKSKRLIKLTLFEQKANIPYTSDTFMSYDAELYNFLRWSGNGLNGHPDKRPFYLAQFGGKDGLNAPEDLLLQYRNPEISAWDWPWLIKKYSRNTIENYIGAIAKRKFRQKFSGTFTAVDSTDYIITAGDTQPLKTAGYRAKAMAPGGISYKVLSDLDDVPGKVENLQFSVIQNEEMEAIPSPDSSPF